ncbi:MAG: hypothetical protein ACRD4B_10565, partial [Acidobacteriota bacterium]
MDDTIDVGSATTGLRVTTSGQLSDIDGNVSINDALDLSGNFAQSGATSFSTGTGSVSLNGATSVIGSNTFSVGTGLTSLGGALTVSGTSTLHDALLAHGSANFTNATGITIGEDVAGGSSNTPGQLTLVSDGDNAFSTNFVTTTQSQDVTYTLPSNDGESNYVLTTDGNGGLTWQSTSGVGAGTINGVGNVAAGSAFTGSDSSTNKGNQLVFEGSTTVDDANDLTLTADAITGSSKTITLPDLTGTVALLEGTQTFSGAKSFTNASGITIGEDIAGGSSNTPGQLTLVSDGDNAYTTRFVTTTQSQDITYTLPANDGDSNYVLTTDGNGGLTWQSTSGVGAGTINGVG